MKEMFIFSAFVFLYGCETQKNESAELVNRSCVCVDRAYLSVLEAEVHMCRAHFEKCENGSQTPDSFEPVVLPEPLTMCQPSFPHTMTDLDEIPIVVSELQKDREQKTLPPIVNVQLGQFTQTALTEEQIGIVRKQIRVLGELAMRCLANAARNDVSNESSGATKTFKIPVRVILENGRVWETGFEEASMPFASKETLLCIDRSIYKLIHLPEDEERHVFTFVLALKIHVSKFDPTEHKPEESYVPVHVDLNLSRP